MRWMTPFLRREDGQNVVEYGVAVVAIALAAIAGANALRLAEVNYFTALAPLLVK
jgi:Flp pilus assembly pilin Flp